MTYRGVIIHHSACPCINGKGFDYYVTRQGVVIPGKEATDPDYIHLCIEGDFDREQLTPEIREQLFTATRLIARLAEAHGAAAFELYPHAESCPGSHFPWSELVISSKNGYH